ncbi:MAG: hypothetical protein N6V41_01290, partial [Candidatus Portiera aleyrodidarum]|nr:hypothetical protein [Candidatus Portiera aleyrodidarum]
MVDVVATIVQTMGEEAKIQIIKDPIDEVTTTTTTTTTIHHETEIGTVVEATTQMAVDHDEVDLVVATILTKEMETR